jgi:uncharacterized membrane protein YphA (DoxX/SURF4 family)
MVTFLYILSIILIIVATGMVTMGFKTQLVFWGILLFVIAYFTYVILPQKVEKWKAIRNSKKLDEKGS